MEIKERSYSRGGKIASAKKRRKKYITKGKKKKITEKFSGGGATE